MADEPEADDQSFEVGDHEAIRSKAQDLLHRASFAQRIAREIAAAPTRSSTVVAVVGPWGSGKTSVLNMVTEALASAERVTVLQFNPWLFSSPEDLVRSFFDELASELIDDADEALKKVGALLQRYGRRMALLRFLPFVGDAARIVLEGIKSAGSAMEEAADTGPSSLRGQHAELRGLLAKLERRLVVVVDDIDRLRRDEVREVMRLVRLTADLPNLTFLLAFDRTIVEMSLTEVEPDGRVYLAGRGYLEKIVQQVYDVPTIQPTDLESVLLDGLDRVTSTRAHGPLHERDFLNILHRGLKRLFLTVREVRRYIAVLPLALEDCGTEVALEDVLALEGVRVMLPDVFALLPVSIDALTPPRETISPAQRQEHTRQFQALLDVTGPRLLVHPL